MLRSTSKKMQKIFAPWRIEYILKSEEKGCLFCNRIAEKTDNRNFILYRSNHNFVILNTYPYNTGHLMIAPYRHIANLEELTRNELIDMMEVNQLLIKILKKALKPDGFNIGINIGKSAGAGVEGHLHLHIVPRWAGDTNFMPVIASCKVIPEHIKKTYKRLKHELKLIKNVNNYSIIKKP